MDSSMSQQHEDLLSAGADGDLKRVRELFQSFSPSGGLGDVLEELMFRAAKNGHAAIVTFCLDQGVEVSDRVTDEALDFPEVCKVLITAGKMDVNEDLEMAGDLLINAVWEGKLEFTKWLLEHGADPNSGHLLAESTSAITAAAERGRLDLAELLVNHGARVSGTGALAAAAGKGQIDMVRYLIDQGADVDVVGVHDYGDRRKKVTEGAPLHKAVARGDVAIAKLLLDHGATIDMKDPMGRTPLALSKQENQVAAREYLESMGGTT